MKILLENKIAIKLRAYTLHAKGEVSGYGKSIMTEEGDILIIDIALFDQECSSSSTNLDVSALAKFMYEKTQGGESLKNWNVWWHTHGDLGVFWSGTDDDTIEEHVKNNKKLISIVTNKEGELLGRVDVLPIDSSEFGIKFTPHQTDADVEVLVNKDMQEYIDETVKILEIEKNEWLDKMVETDKLITKTQEMMLFDSDIDAECKKEVEAKVKEKVYSIDRVSSKKKGKNLDTGVNGQGEFENALDDVIYGIEDEYIDDHNIYICPKCQNPISECTCLDSYTKWGDRFGDKYDTINSYIANQFKHIHKPEDDIDIEVIQGREQKKLNV